MVRHFVLLEKGMWISLKTSAQTEHDAFRMSKWFETNCGSPVITNQYKACIELSAW